MGCGSVVQYLPIMHKVLGSIPNIMKQQQQTDRQFWPITVKSLPKPGSE